MANRPQGKKRRQPSTVAVSPHNVLAAAFLILISLLDDAPFIMSPSNGDVWNLVIREEWIFAIFMDCNEPDYVTMIKGPNDILIQFGFGDPTKTMPENLEEAWRYIFMNVVSMDHVRERIMAAVRVHPEWPYA